jgi:hypothetical protein
MVNQKGGATMKKLLALLLAVTMFLTMSSAALADDDSKVYSSVPTEGTPASGAIGSAEGSAGRAAMAAASDGETIHLYSWRNSIQEYSSAYLKLYGMTMTDIFADKVETDFYLQRWDGSIWVNISTSYNYIYDDDYLALSICRSVCHGYYYRVKTVHRAWLGDSYDVATLYSSYIYVS